MRTNKSWTRLLAAAVTSALAAGVSTLGLTTTAVADSATPTPSPSGGKVTFTVGMTNDIDSANPFTGVAAESYEIYQMMYPTLTEYSAKDFGIVPGLAESWQESPDRTTWTYKIRTGVKWSDGVPLTAKDAAYTFNRVINGQTEQTNYGNYVANISKAAAPDDSTLVLTVKRPTPIMTRLFLYILPEHIWKNVSEKQVKSYPNEPIAGQPVVGSGPFLLAERRTGQFIRMVANPDFYRGKPAIDEVVFKIFKNQDAMGQALKKGEIDFADSLEANVFKSLANAPGVTQFPAIYSGFDQLAFNTGAALATGKPIGDGNPLLKDKALRQALGWAIDRQKLVDRVLGGYGSAGSTIVPEMYVNLHLAPANTVGYDPGKARSLLDAAGYKVGADGIRAATDGTRLSFRLFGRSESTTSKQSVAFIKSFLNDVGVEVNVKLVASDNLTQIIGEGKYDMFEWGWVVEPDPDYQLSTFTCAKRSYEDGGAVYADLSDSFYCNPAYDALYDKQGGETDEAKRTEIVKTMQQMLYDDSPYIVTYYYDNPEAYRSDRFTGFVPQPEGKGSLLFQYGTWSYENIKPVTAEVSAGQGTPTSASASSGGPNWPLITGIIVLALLAAGAGVALARGRSRGFDDTRE